MKQPLPDLRYWVGPALILMALFISLWVRYTDRNRDPSQLHIIYARYMWGTRLWQRRNVKRIICSHIRNNFVALPVSNDYFGDPKFGLPKTLIVKYSYFGFTRTTRVLPEDRPNSPSCLVLPEPELRKTLEQMFSNSPDGE